MGRGMRAAVLEPGGKLEVGEIEIEDPRPGEVLVRVSDCGVCHSDLSIVEGSVPGPTPTVLGHEAAGEAPTRSFLARLTHHERLVEEVHESSSMSVLDGDDIVYVARVPTKRIMSVALGIGARLPAAATSMGRVSRSTTPRSVSLSTRASVGETFSTRSRTWRI